MTPIKYEVEKLEGPWEYSLKGKVEEDEDEGYRPLGAPVYIPPSEKGCISVDSVVQAMYKEPENAVQRTVKRVLKVFGR